MARHECHVVHFTPSVESLLSIVSEGLVRPSGPFGRGMSIADVAERHLSACFSERPLDLIDRLMSRHGRYGVGFLKKYSVESGGARVWYLEKGHPPDTALFALVGQLLRDRNFQSEMWSLTPFIAPWLKASMNLSGNVSGGCREDWDSVSKMSHS